MNHLVVISGPQGSGKTTLSQALRKKAKDYNYNMVASYKFADVLYELHEYILNKMERYTGIKRVAKDGVLLQLLGTEWGRQTFGENVWVNVLKNKIDSFGLVGNRLIVIDDCRFPNEFHAFPDALRIRLECPEEQRKARTDSWRENTKHPSETSLDSYAELGLFDLYLHTGKDSDHSPEEVLAAQVANIMELLISQVYLSERTTKVEN